MDGWWTRIWRNERGMALLITIMTIALLVVLTVQFQKSTWNRFLAAHNYRTETLLNTIADSGISIAIAVLRNDATVNETDSWHDNWARLETEPLDDLFPAGTLKIKVYDLSGRFPINNLVEREGDGEESVDAPTAMENRNILQRLLLSGVFPVENETEATSIVHAIVDWIDEDDLESDYGAESSYYQSLEKPYSCRNQPARYIEELLLVRGVTPALLFGTDTSPGLADFLTVYGSDGRININTASPLLIQSIEPLINNELVERLDSYRKDKDNEEQLANPGWYRNISGWPGDIVINDRIVTSKSTFFLVRATGSLDTLSRTIAASAERVSADEVNLLVKKME